MNDLRVEQIIRALKLEPLPAEGGLYSQSYCSAEFISPAGLPARYTGPRPFGTAIYYLLTAESHSFSALHRLATDEIYHFYMGDPVEMLVLHPNEVSQRVRLGSDLLSGQQVQFVVPAGAWQGSRLAPGGSYALLGTTMAPGFDAADFTLGARAELLTGWPAEAGMIHQLTRA